MTKKINREVSSFRDPAGYIYYSDDKVYRKIFKCYFKQYNHLMSSGLYDLLVEKKLLVAHKEIERTKDYITLEVEKIPFISYPYEWGYEQFKDASLLTLEINRLALEYDMILKDASGFNVQFLNGMPIFIDTLSFDFYEEGAPWGAYGQFVRHFMGPILLMKHVDERLNCLLKNYIDGIPVDLAEALLKGRGGFTAKQHIKWHSKAIAKHSDSEKQVKTFKMPRVKLKQMIDMMIRQIDKLNRVENNSEWGDYYQHTNYDDASDKDKIKLVNNYLKEINLTNEDIVFDLGANDGKYSRIAAEENGNVISFDIDINCINHNYSMVKKKKESNILPLFLDVTNPTPDIGFGLVERRGINSRGNAKCVMALALIHHIAISNNVLFDDIALWFSKLGNYLIIEFVPKEDSQVKKLLKTRKDIFDWYNVVEFEKSMCNYFKIIKKDRIKNSKRIIYLMEGNNHGKQ